MRRAVVITGPTGGGKSAMALAIADRIGGTIVNADSMQVYSELRIVTARPSLADETRHPHRLYGHVRAAEAYSVGRFVTDAAAALADARAAGRVPIVVGGTGLYLQALLIGLSPIPPVPGAVRQHWREMAAATGAHGLHRLLVERDPAMAARLRPGDTQRIVRALEVIAATGRSLSHWQALPGVPVLPVAETVRVALVPPRAELTTRCDRRIDQMLAAGALAEIAALSERALDPALPAMRAVGVRPLIAHLAGDMALDAAVAAMRQDTRHYVKRQLTWLKRTMFRFDAEFVQFSECDLDQICSMAASQLDARDESGKA